MKIKIFACNFRNDSDVELKDSVKLTAENLANKNGFKFFQYYSDSDREIMHMFKFIVTELYCKYYNLEEDWKLYQINNLLIKFFNKEIGKGNFLLEIKTLLEKANKFGEIKIDENKILTETFHFKRK